jgi:hypothetical protein
MFPSPTIWGGRAPIAISISTFLLSKQQHTNNTTHTKTNNQIKMALRAAAPARATFRNVAGARRAVVASRVRVVKVDAAKRSVGDLKKADLEGKRVFVRCDLNVPLDKELNITDDTRIRAAVDTLKYLSDNGAKVIVTSHLVRSGIFFLHRSFFCFSLSRSFSIALALLHSQSSTNTTLEPTHFCCIW